MIHYLLQIIAIQLLFLLVYDLFLKKETFFTGNRLYLIASPLLSLIIPFIKVDTIREHIPDQYIIQLPEILLNTNRIQPIQLPEIVLTSSTPSLQFINVSQILFAVWFLGATFSLFLFLLKIHKILKLKHKGTKTKIDTFTIISLPNTTSAFSFFRTIFLGELLSETKRANILLHEKTHVSQYHSLDLIFFEVLRIAMWFNPLVYIYQHRITVLQEYIADAKAVSETSKKEYYQNLLSQVFQTDNISFINTFFNHSLIKKRIVMLQKSKSKKIFQLKYLLLIPVVSVMLVYTSCSDETSAQTSAAQTPLLEKINAVHEQLQIQGNVSPEEEEALKKMALLVTNDFTNPKYANTIDAMALPFGTIEKVPVYPGCEGLSQEETKKCFGEKISQFITSEFNVKVAEEENISGRQKIGVQFSIGRDGKIKNIKTKNKHLSLRNEAIRVLENLPVMTPGQQQGVNVSVLYELPIVFEIK